MPTLSKNNSDVTDARCQYCNRTFPRGSRGLRNHIKQSSRCKTAHNTDLERRRKAGNVQVTGALGNKTREPVHEPERLFFPEHAIGLEEFVQGSSSGRARSIDLEGSDSDRPLKRARGEDADEDEDAHEDDILIQEFPTRPQIYGHKRTRWERMRDARVAGVQGRWGGFANEEEWELARWLIKSGVSQTELDKYLKLGIVSPRDPSRCFPDINKGLQTRNRTKLSYKNKRNFLQLIDGLPTSNIPGFSCEVISVKGTQVDAEGNPRTEVLELWKRDPVECVREIMSNPALAASLQYEPQKIFSNLKCEEQIYNEAWTGEWWWDAQVRTVSQLPHPKPD